MGRKTIRVNLPVDEPDETNTLCDRILEKHTALGASSPLTGLFDMTDFGTKLTFCKDNRKLAAKKDGESQKKFNEAAKLCGIAEGQNKQTEGTLYVFVLAIRDYLLIKFRDTPESLSEWGFAVVVSQTGGRRNVRVEIPDDSPETLLALCTLINDKHIADGAGSVLLSGTVDMAVFGTKLGTANTVLDESVVLRGEKEALNQQVQARQGYAEGQTSETPGTLYNFYTGIRDRLLNVSQGVEENLSEWGYDVVLDEASAASQEEPIP